MEAVADLILHASNANAYSGRSDGLTTAVYACSDKLLIAVYIWWRLCMYGGLHLLGIYCMSIQRLEGMSYIC